MVRGRRFVFMCVVGLGGALAGCGPQAAAPPPDERAPSEPNILFIVADALRADRVAATRNGKPVMPQMQQLASESWNYRRARVQATWTKPSMATMFTSLYPEVHNVLFGIHDTAFEGQPPEADILPGEMETMAEYLKAHGYSSAGVQSNANITAVFGFDQGFDSYEFLAYPEYRGNDMTDRAINALDGLRPPFLLYAHYMDTHAPYEPVEPYRDSFGAPPEITPDDAALLNDYPNTYLDRVLFETGLTQEREFGNLSSQGEAYIRQRYDEEALFLDAEVARLIESVRTRYPDTIVIFTSDHGEELWEHGSIGHGKTVFEELTHVPLIISVPGASARTIENPVELVDLLPTCSALLGLAPRETWQGKGMTPEAVDVGETKPAFSSTRMSIPGSNVDLAAVVVENEKLIVNRKTESAAYFDLTGDPEETNPQSDSAAGTALQEVLAAHMKTMQSHPQYGRPSEKTRVDDGTREAIENIGYIR
ncbi:MAG: choline-sulfatase [Candidatus Hydrogenedentota bacterium]